MTIGDHDPPAGAVVPFGYDETIPEAVLPTQQALRHARTALLESLPDKGLGYVKTSHHLFEDIVPGVNAASRSPNFYGFVTGGSTPAASLADNLVTLHDQNVQVHLPNETVATDVEDHAHKLLCDLLHLDPSAWLHRTFTTGATASNVLGLACGREHVIADAARRRFSAAVSVGELGLLRAMRAAGLEDVQILTTVPHSSLSKAASILGLGRACVKLVGDDHKPHDFDMAKLEEALKDQKLASIVAISCAEVNTGFFATESFEEMKKIRELCDRYGAWIHVDAAFGLLGRVLTKPEFSKLKNCTEGIELADSITGDGHKLLNVPYDCGFFLSRHLPLGQQVFQNPNAAYLNVAGSDASSIPSPLNIGIENSRRFRALPVYATLAAYGRDGYRDMLERQITLARGIASLILAHDAYELLPKSSKPHDDILEDIYIIVLFRANDEQINNDLVRRINTTRKIYVSGTSWDGAPACRFAISNWGVDVQRDLRIIHEVLDLVRQG
ncbi:uncharacterized protein K452DRAFT_306466 [Aplosporella prunicola CBS 121167]|uniref:Aminotransferase class V domain-containing protein n=1 Tax=Aplosporella prunicola CBS 121167 TaxID=1176127 RepID=A0A6A6BLX1_9PEZI|nr:uncharacterized protein K452DRAFT_306466 [Aplosporella prunicola CBS 121167]KAF2144678.1 hypothetical protein K452DRAFT_306466 [Aplosporella prunicola CBS 121167]